VRPAHHAGELPDSNFLTCTQALQATIDALTELQTLDQIVPRVLQIVAGHYKAASCFFFTNEPTGEIRLRYSYINGKTLPPDEVVALDPVKFALVRSLAAGFHVPDSYLGKPARLALGPIVLNHALGTSVPEFDRFALDVGWDMELNIGVAACGVRASSLCIYRGRLHPFTPNEVALGESLAKQLGLAVQTVRLAEHALQAAVARDRESARRVNEFLIQTVGGLSNSENLQTALGSLLLTLAHSIHAAHLFLFRHDPVSRTLRLHLSSIDGHLRQGVSGDEIAIWSDSFPDDITPAWRIMCEQRKLFTPAMCPIPPEEFGWPGAFEYAQRFGLSDMGHIVLFAGETPIGSIGLGFRGGAKLQPDDVEFIEAAAQQAAVVIRMLDLSEAARSAALAHEREQAAEARATEARRISDFLNATLGRLTNGDDPASTVETIIAALAREVGARYVFLFRHNSADRTLRLDLTCIDGQIRYGASGAENPFFAAPFPDDITPQWRFMVELRGLLTPHTISPEASDFYWPGWRDCARRLQFSDAGHIVLFAGDQPVGSVGFALCDGHVLKPSDKPFIENIAKQAAIAIRMAEVAETARLAAVAREREAAAQERVVKLAKTNRALKQTLDVVAFEPHFQRVPGKVLEAITSQLESPSSALWLFDKRSGRFAVCLVYDEGKILDVTGKTLPAIKGAWGRARDLFLKDHVRERRPVVYQVRDLKTVHPRAFAFLEKLGVRSMLGVPLLLGAEVLGSLTIRFDTQRELTAEELELTQAMAHQATLAIQLTRLAEQVAEVAIGEERARFARDIHDTLAQGFTGILMQLGAASQIPGDQRSDIASHLQTIASLARANLAEARRSVLALRPLSNPECRLDSTLEHYIETIRLQTTADVSFQVKGTRGGIAPHVEKELCRIVQESLNNAVKHAAARKISVSVEFQEGDAARLSVKDDGVGFDPALRPASDRFGLVGMQERAASIGASLTVVSEQSRGAEIIVQYGKARS
jgi:signal transduction histidine kinase